MQISPFAPGGISTAGSLGSTTYMCTPASPAKPIGKPWAAPASSSLASKKLTSTDASVGP